MFTFGHALLDLELDHLVCLHGSQLLHDCLLLILADFSPTTAFLDKQTAAVLSNGFVFLQELEASYVVCFAFLYAGGPAKDLGQCLVLGIL